jgi:hypothetical protein
MKKIQKIIATSHVDLHGDMIHPKALKDAVRQIKEKYLPYNIEHDIRRPPIGRIVSAKVTKLQDGQYALVATAELFEKSDSLESLTGDGRKIPIRDRDIQTIDFYYDSTFLDKKGKELLRGLSQISGKIEGSREIVKKALEPVSTFLICMGVFIVGSIAKGFLSKLGSDAYEMLKNRLIKYFRNRKNISSEQILDFCFSVKQNNKNFEVHVLVINPSEQKLDDLFASRFNEIDNLLDSLPLSESDVARIVLEYENQTLLVRYALKSDSVPFMFVKKEKKEGNIDYML